MNTEKNPQLALAFDFVQYTDKTIFLTGKAGTGKTTFLHNLKKVSPKRMVVVAPTGVAAINAGGVTIHSFFQMPFGPYISEDLQRQSSGSDLNPQSSLATQKKFNREKIHLIKSIDLLVIDEISMVRADMLDGIDEVLRKYKDRSKPFGGVQLLMIGDLHQLAPVIKDDEWNILKKYYDTVYFFSSKALQKTKAISIELKYIYRQSDAYFIDILSKIRHKTIDTETLKALNQRYIPNFEPKDEDGYIILTTHNANAHETNQSRLNKIKHKSHIFKADVEADFPAFSYPTEERLELKKDAQVMFVKNDSSHEKLYYNGKIGKITRIADDIVYVKCPADKSEIPVGIEEWQNVKYSVDSETKEIRENVAGSFKQYPLKLAWAITIHKSQGLTFEKAVIDANASFAHGQVYVALSRCKSFDGLVLSSPITLASIKTDDTIAEFSNDINTNPPGKQELADSKFTFQKSLLYELFDFKKIQNSFYYFKKNITDNANIIDAAVINDLSSVEIVAINEIYAIAEKFRLQLEQLSIKNILPEENTELIERVKKAAIYFAEKTDTILYAFTRNINFETDNKAVKKTINESLEFFQKEIFIKLLSLKSSINGFKTIEYLRVKSNAEIDFKASLKTVKTTKTTFAKDLPHALLYAELKQWRDIIADEHNYPVFMVLPHKAMMELLAHLPTSLPELENIKGIGKKKVKQFGNEIIEIIREYCENNVIEKPQIEIKIKPVKNKAEKPDSKKLSFEMAKAGKTIQEIAKVRNFSISTIEGHLAHYIATGDLDIHSFVSKEKAKAISDYFAKNKTISISKAKTDLGNKVTYAELKFVMKYLEYLGKQGF
jgi:uncharacterized protein YpbB